MLLGGSGCYFRETCHAGAKGCGSDLFVFPFSVGHDHVFTVGINDGTVGQNGIIDHAVTQLRFFSFGVFLFQHPGVRGDAGEGVFMAQVVFVFAIGVHKVAFHKDLLRIFIVVFCGVRIVSGKTFACEQHGKRFQKKYTAFKSRHGRRRM